MRDGRRKGLGLLELRRAGIAVPKAAEKALLCPSAPVSGSGSLALLYLAKDHTGSFPKPAVTDFRFSLSCAISQQNCPEKTVNSTSTGGSGQGGGWKFRAQMRKKMHHFLSILARG